MVFDKVHEVIAFKRSKWLGKYIKFNTQKNRAKGDFEEDFFKLLSNVFFGELLENIRNRLILDFIENCEKKKFLNNNRN